MPTLIIHGRGDVAVPFEEGRLLATLIPEAEFVPMESRNHVLIPDDPAFEQIVALIERFLGDGAAAAGQAPEVADRGEAGGVVKLPEDLTRREREVLELIAQGLDNASIAARLGLSPKTVRNYVANTLSKLQVGHRSAAIVLAREAGLGRGQGAG